MKEATKRTIVVGLATHYTYLPASNVYEYLGPGRERWKRPCISKQNCIYPLGTWNVKEINGEEQGREVVNF